MIIILSQLFSKLRHYSDGLVLKIHWVIAFFCDLALSYISLLTLNLHGRNGSSSNK